MNTISAIITNTFKTNVPGLKRGSSTSATGQLQAENPTYYHNPRPPFNYGYLSSVFMVSASTECFL